MTRWRWAALAAAIVALWLLPYGLKQYGIYLLTSWCVWTIAGLGLNLTVGYAGQISLAQAAFLGIGAYANALLLQAGVAFFAALPVSALICFGVGLALGFPALRVRHHYLAFATLGFNVLVFLLARNEDWLTGGSLGLNNIPRPTLLGWRFTTALDFYHVTLVALLVVAGLMALLLRSPWGRAFAALRDNPIRAESVGIDTTFYTLMAFAIGAACGGVAGAFFASMVRFIDPTPFGLANSLAMLLMVVVGGQGRFFGPALGAVVVVLLPEWLRFAADWYLALFGFLVVAMMIWLPGGLLSLPGRFTRGARR
ncbi:Branched-chain amino acid ABC transporter permease [Rhodovastum atsumiense]|uniref:Branched-chain amino acid ABC transporter permease n=1 Tax=Rhodovastum atsumiense TaxID=504468 RepID=A0A5M6J538_9PROT|nr:branched-chain amino acid ABC transporter permease [Rhodovastum atsumiense]KAA5614718.1 branched-chain amino acid ABC transporter permease [Rhodovastum atsumiense]CAH2599745.1 Branched-chain amino acid ABC transporter permease [Rhodovastum atsumiense]